MTPDDMARLHAAAMTTPRPWSAAEFASLLAMPSIFAIATPQALALGRVTLDEVELLTLATDPAHRRQGHGGATLAAFHKTARTSGAVTAFLEVAASNTPARALYHAAGYHQIGKRRGYYKSPHGNADDALILSRAL